VCVCVSVSVTLAGAGKILKDCPRLELLNYITSMLAAVAAIEPIIKLHYIYALQLAAFEPIIYYIIHINSSRTIRKHRPRPHGPNFWLHFFPAPASVTDRHTDRQTDTHTDRSKVYGGPVNQTSLVNTGKFMDNIFFVLSEYFFLNLVI
jgi:hypothetical protein